MTTSTLEKISSGDEAAIGLRRALELWIEVTGVDPSKRSFKWGELDTLQMHNALKEALELDDTEITGNLLFDYLATEYFRERSFSVEDLLEKPEMVAQYLEKSRELLSYVRSPAMRAIEQGFSAQMSKAATQYGAQTDAVQHMLGEPHMLALLRRDAMRTLKHLQINQFLMGTPESEEIRPVYGKFVYRWWNINSMLKAMTTMPSGVTVNLICHPTDPYRSYFVFAIRNGGNLFVFTDKENTPHPMAEDMVRRPDKVLAERAARNWFPYELMGLAFDEEGKVYVATSKETGLVPYQSKAQPVKAIAELAAPNVLWLVMMLDLIVQKFWREGYKAPVLSYTGEMVQTTTPLLEAASAANLPVTGYQPLSLAPLTMQDVRSEAISAKHVGKLGHGENKWMEVRYGDQVSDQIINSVRTPNSLLSLDIKDGTHTLMPRTEGFIASWERAKLAKHRFDIDALDATSFGTREEIEADRRFIARSNFAQHIQKLAEQEFEARKSEITEWVRARVTANLPSLYPLMARTEIMVPAIDFKNVFSHGAYTWRGETNNGFMRRFVKREGLTGEKEFRKKHLYVSFTNGNLPFTGKVYKNGCPSCFHTNAPSSFTVEFLPETTEDLAFLCGCSVSELPDVLQHWTMINRHVGNSILQRIDPLEWQCKNPWRKLHFGLMFFFSIRAMKAIDKEYGGMPITLPQNRVTDTDETSPKAPS